MVPGWSGSVPVQLIFFNSYILNPFLFDKNLTWSLSFILKKIYEFFNTINTKTLVPSLLIWSRAGPGSIIENKSPLHTQIMPCSTSLICLKWKTNQLIESINFFVSKIKNYVTSSKPKKLVPGPYSTTWSYISLAYNKNMADEDKYLYAFRRSVYNLHLIQISARYMHVWQQYSADKIWSRILVPGSGRWSRVLFLPITVEPVNNIHWYWWNAKMTITHQDLWPKSESELFTGDTSKW